MKTIVLDRDGVINEDSDNYIKSVEEFLPIPGSIEAIVKLSEAGFRVVVATNQSGIARGFFDEHVLSDMHHKLCSMVEDAGGKIDGIFYCPHSPDDKCECRKPKTGMLQQIEYEFGDTLSHSFFIGDSLKDLEAALAFDCKPVLVRTGKGIDTEKALVGLSLPSIPVFDNLAIAVKELLVL